MRQPMCYWKKLKKNNNNNQKHEWVQNPSLTHTHVRTRARWFLWLTGTLHRRKGFILYKPYFLSPYTNPKPKPTPYRKICAFFISPKKKILYDL